MQRSYFKRLAGLTRALEEDHARFDGVRVRARISTTPVRRHVRLGAAVVAVVRSVGPVPKTGRRRATREELGRSGATTAAAWRSRSSLVNVADMVGERWTGALKKCKRTATVALLSRSTTTTTASTAASAATTSSASTFSTLPALSTLFTLLGAQLGTLSVVFGTLFSALLALFSTELAVLCTLVAELGLGSHGRVDGERRRGRDLVASLRLGATEEDLDRFRLGLGVTAAAATTATMAMATSSLSVTAAVASSSSATSTPTSASRACGVKVGLLLIAEYLETKLKAACLEAERVALGTFGIVLSLGRRRVGAFVDGWGADLCRKRWVGDQDCGAGLVAQPLGGLLGPADGGEECSTAQH